MLGTAAIECIIGTVNANGLLFIMMCGCKSIIFNKSTTLENDVNHETVYACMGVGSIWEISEHLQMTVKVKFLLKKVLQNERSTLDPPN